MISLYNTLKESLLGGFDEIEASTDPKKEIEKFIKDNYDSCHIKISKKPNENGKYVVSCVNHVFVKNPKILSLTNGIFEWGTIKNGFYCAQCNSLTSLEGAPKEVGGSFQCAYCDSLTSLEGAPKKVGGTFNCVYCRSLTSLEGVPEIIKGDFNCFGCSSLKTLKGAPKEVGGSFTCTNCSSLTSLEGAPKKVERCFDCSCCGKQFTKKDVKKVCDVNVDRIIVDSLVF